MRRLDWARSARHARIGDWTLDGALVIDSLLSAPVLAFVLAVVAGLARFELRLPEALPPVLATFLLFAIGLKGGRSLRVSHRRNWPAPCSRP